MCILFKWCNKPSVLLFESTFQQGQPCRVHGTYKTEESSDTVVSKRATFLNSNIVLFIFQINQCLCHPISYLITGIVTTMLNIEILCNIFVLQLFTVEN